MITAGNRYTYEGQPVLAMEDAERGIVLVRRIDPSVPVIGMQRSMFVAAERLVPAPMRYHQGAVPGEMQ